LVGQHISTHPTSAYPNAHPFAYFIAHYGSAHHASTYLAAAYADAYYASADRAKSYVLQCCVERRM
jgi:hypothetical protein